MELPNPCVYCRTRRKHDCKLQAVCAKVKRYYRRRLEWDLVDYGVKNHDRIEKRMSRRH